MKSALFAEARSRLLLAMGVTPMLATAACGGIAVFVHDDGSGGAGGSGTTSASTTMASTTSGCPNVEMVPTVCFDVPAGGCPAADSPAAEARMREHLNDTCVSTEPEFCGCSVSELNLLCGPFGGSGACCYLTDYSIQEICEGRPLTVAGKARIAEPAFRDDWLVFPAPSSDVGPISDLSPEARAALSEGWLRSAQYEHASVASFARVVLELLAIGAPADLVAGAQQAAADEIVHAKLAFGIASALGGAPLGPGPLVTDDAPMHADAASIVAATIREGCIGETISAMLALAARDLATEPTVVAALTRIADDELRHAELAWRTVAWALRAKLPGAAEAARTAFGARAVCEHEADAFFAIEPAISERFGLLSAAQKHAIAERTREQVIGPSAIALLGSASATHAPMESFV